MIHTLSGLTILRRENCELVITCSGHRGPWRICEIGFEQKEELPGKRSDETKNMKTTKQRFEGELLYKRKCAKVDRDWTLESTEMPG